LELRSEMIIGCVQDHAPATEDHPRTDLKVGHYKSREQAKRRIGSVYFTRRKGPRAKASMPAQ